MMTAKQQVIEAIHRLPEEATFGDIAEEIAFLAAVREGAHDLEENKVLSNDEMKQRLEKWLTK